jgi:hypothetical protein
MNNIIATGNVIFVYFDYDEYIEKDNSIIQDTKCTKMSIIYNNPTMENLYNFLNVIGKKQGKRNRKLLEYSECNDYIKESHFDYNENIQYLSIQLERDMTFNDYNDSDGDDYCFNILYPKEDTNIVKQPKKARLC